MAQEENAPVPQFFEPPNMEQVQRTKDKADEVLTDVEDISKVIRRQRFERLDAHAKVQGWLLTRMPKECADNKVALAWWQEWVLLKFEFDPPPQPKEPEPQK